MRRINEEEKLREFKIFIRIYIQTASLDKKYRKVCQQTHASLFRIIMQLQVTCIKKKKIKNESTVKIFVHALKWLKRHKPKKLFSPYPTLSFFSDLHWSHLFLLLDSKSEYHQLPVSEWEFHISPFWQESFLWQISGRRQQNKLDLCETSYHPTPSCSVLLSVS